MSSSIHVYTFVHIDMYILVFNIYIYICNNTFLLYNCLMDEALGCIGLAQVVSHQLHWISQQLLPFASKGNQINHLTIWRFDIPNSRCHRCHLLKFFMFALLKASPSKGSLPRRTCQACHGMWICLWKKGCQNVEVDVEKISHWSDDLSRKRRISIKSSNHFNPSSRRALGVFGPATSF